MKNKFTIFLVLLLALTLGIQPTIAKKPLTTITFDGYTLWQPVNRLTRDGVTYKFTVHGNESDAAQFGVVPSSSTLTQVQGHVLEGPSIGELTLEFDKPTTIIEFGVALYRRFPINNALTIDLYRPGHNELRETISVSTSPDPDFSEGYFSYHGPAVKKIVINFIEIPGIYYYYFNIDNLVFHN